MHIKRHDRVLLWLNILFLMCVASMPFPTGLIIRYGQQQISILVYAGTLVLAGLMLDLVWWYATHGRRLVDENIDPRLVAFVHRRVLMAPLIYLFAIAVSFFSILVAKLLFIAVALVYVVPNPLDHHHRRQVHKPRAVDEQA
jgi:uncharacterized membrane protein